jgi:hypothetical protein
MNTDQKIKDIEKELDTNVITKQRRRYLESELDFLKKEKSNLNCLEIFCNENPSAPECRIYDL